MKMLFVAALLSLCATHAALAQGSGKCPEGSSWRMLNEIDIDEQGIRQPVEIFTAAVKLGRERLGVASAIHVTVLTCPRHYQPVETLMVFAAVPLFSPNPVYSIYVTVSFLRNAEEDTLPKVAINRVCRVNRGTVALYDFDTERYAHLQAERCMAQVLGDQKALDWLARVLPP